MRKTGEALLILVSLELALHLLASALPIHAYAREAILALAFLSPFLLLRRTAVWRSLYRPLPLLPADRRRGAAAGLLLLPPMVLSVTLVGMATERLLPLPAISASPAEVILFSVLLAPLTEELFVRGTILPLLLPHSRASALLVSSLLFGLMHLNVAQLPYAVTAGLFLGAAALCSDSLLVPIAMHLASNLLQFLLSLLSGSVAEETVLKAIVLSALAILSLPALWYAVARGLRSYRGAHGRMRTQLKVALRTLACTLPPAALPHTAALLILLGSQGGS